MKRLPRLRSWLGFAKGGRIPSSERWYGDGRRGQPHSLLTPEEYKAVCDDIIEAQLDKEQQKQCCHWKFRGAICQCRDTSNDN